MVNRYNCYGWDIRRGEMRREDDGHYVYYSDYADLEAENVRLANDIGTMLDDDRKLCQAAGPRAESDDLEAHIRKLRVRTEASAAVTEAMVDAFKVAYHSSAHESNDVYGFDEKKAIRDGLTAALQAALEVKP